MVNAKLDGYFQFFAPVKFVVYHSKTMMLKKKVAVMYFQLLKNYLYDYDMLSVENLFQMLNQMSQTSKRKFGVNPSSSYDFV